MTLKYGEVYYKRCVWDVYAVFVCDVWKHTCFVSFSGMKWAVRYVWCEMSDVRCVAWDSSQQGPYTTHVRHQTVLVKPARRQTRMTGTHQHNTFAFRIAQWPRTQFTHSKIPNLHGSNTSTQNVRSSYWHSTARRQTRITVQRVTFASPHGTTTPTTIYTHHKTPSPHARNTSTQQFRISGWHSYPERNLHTPRRQTRMTGTHQHTIFASPINAATPNAIYTQQGAASQKKKKRHCTVLFPGRTNPLRTFSAIAEGTLPSYPHQQP